METIIINIIRKLKSWFMQIFYFDDNCRNVIADWYTQISSIWQKLKDTEGKLKYMVSFKWNLSPDFEEIIFTILLKYLNFRNTLLLLHN